MMQFDSLLAAWQMNGHGPFVWSAYLICLVVLVSLVWAPLARKRRLLRELRGAERRRQHARSAPGV
jgi:heme exporter protein D